MTDPKILEAERIGMPEYKPVLVNCPNCGEQVTENSLRPCEAHKGEMLCLKCEERWIPEYGWHFCTNDVAIEYLISIIQSQDDEILTLKERK